MRAVPCCRFVRKYLLVICALFIAPGSATTQDQLPELVRRIKPSAVAIETFDARGEKLSRGSGFFVDVDRIVTNLDKVLAAALSRVRDCKCGDIASSCYACLRTYSNQFHWDQLQRKPVIDWLSAILGTP